MKRILLVQNDPSLATCFGESLAAAGFYVHAASDGESAVTQIAEVKPQLVLLDVLLPDMPAGELIRRLRADRNLRDLPIIVLPTDLQSLAQGAQKAGATKVLERFIHPIANVVKAVETTIGKETPELAAPLDFRAIAGPQFRTMEAEFPERVKGLAAQPAYCDAANWRSKGLDTFLQQVHTFCEQAAVLELTPLYRLASALEGMALDLHAMPEQLNASVLRTLGQGIDFLATLLDDDRRGQTKEPAQSRVLVVEDDGNARQLIVAALQLVELAAIPAATPGSTLEALRSGSFDLIFLDVGLPEMTGFDLCAEIRKIADHKKTPIVFLTGMATFQNRVQSSLSGGNDFVGKPFNIRELGVKALFWVFKGQLGEV